VQEHILLHRITKYPVSYKYSYPSWWWSQRGLKHVEVINKTDEIYREYRAPSWFHLRDIYIYILHYPLQSNIFFICNLILNMYLKPCIIFKIWYFISMHWLRKFCNILTYLSFIRHLPEDVQISGRNNVKGMRCVFYTFIHLTCICWFWYNI